MSMRKYTFEQIEHTMPVFHELGHVYLADSLTGALRKFTRQHELDMPAYWDEPQYDRDIILTFKSSHGTVTYRITW